MSNEKPILFRDDMVRAILEGRKAQTRRIVKGIDHDLLNMMSEDIVTGEPDSDLLELIYGPSTDDDGNQVPDQWMVRCTECPEEGVLTMGQGYGKPGDQLWVKEVYGYKIRAVGGTPHELAAYRATDPDAVFCYDCNGKEQPLLWRPPETMPRQASRITLEITDVRVERLQDISHLDAIAEGVDHWMVRSAALELEDLPDQSWVGGFKWLWQSIYGPGSWDANPWVWVVEFKCVDQKGV